MEDNGPSKHRSKCRIFADILRAVQQSDSAKVTYLLHEANLSYGRLIDYLTLMERSGLIEKRTNDIETLFLITVKGKKYLMEFKKFEDFGNMFGVEI